MLLFLIQSVLNALLELGACFIFSPCFCTWHTKRCTPPCRCQRSIPGIITSSRTRIAKPMQVLADRPHFPLSGWRVFGCCSLSVVKVFHTIIQHNQEMSRLHRGKMAKAPSLFNLFIRHQHGHRHMAFSITISTQ